ncbi:MAG: FxsA family protein [Fibrobacter sp.]|jgi:UPF0716 protein FxsA|nr:FxsA family protein [Fibrobacter sp.]
MFARLLLLFLLIPLIELYVLIRIGSFIGALNTIFLLILTAATGAILARKQGMNTLWQIQQSLSMGKIPAGELLDGLLIIFAAILLISPGIVTDMMSFLLLIPFTRRFFKRWIKRRMQNWIDRKNGMTPV